MGTHSVGERYTSAVPPASPQQLMSQRPPRTVRRSLLPVFDSLAVLVVVAGTATIVLGSGMVRVSLAQHPAAYSARSASPTARPGPAVAGSPVMIGFADIARVPATGRPAHDRRKSTPQVTSTPAHDRRRPTPQVTSTPSEARTPHASATHAPSLVSTLENLPINTELTGSQAVGWAKVALAALGAPATSANVQTMLDWFSNEGTPHDYNNPLNLNTAYGGSTISTADGDPPSVHVQAYPTPADFAQAFAIQIGGDPSYPAITAALKSGVGLEGSVATQEIASELLVYSGGGYDSIPGTP